jgi:signal transduction histidine kinase
MRREVEFLGQQQPPPEQESGASMPLPPLPDIAGVPSSRRDMGSKPDDTREQVPRRTTQSFQESGRRVSQAASSLHVLRRIAASLPGTENLRLWAYQPPQSAEAACFTEIFALHREQNLWPAIPPLSPTEASEQQVLSALAERIARENPTQAVPSVLHFPDMVLIMCKSEQGEVRGVLEIEPDTTSGGSGAEILSLSLDLISALGLAALELELSVPQTEQRLEEVAAEESRARDAFISFAAHELRGPLTSIKGYAQLLARQSRKYPLPDAMIRSVHSIEQQSARMSEMLGEMLDASRILHGRLDVLLTTVDLATLVDKTVERRRPFFPDHNMVVVGTESPLVGTWDGGRVEQILRDLVDNAARHSPNGSTIAVELSRADGAATVTVRDQGIGIAEADRERIFDYLSRTPESERRNLSGLGLGLFVSRHLAEHLGGRLWLEASSTTPPSGSTFAFTLPVSLVPEAE